MRNRSLAPGQHARLTFALRACTACNSKKRKCDKQLPSCSLCIRTGAHCYYRYAATYAITVPVFLENPEYWNPQSFSKSVCVSCRAKKKSCDKRIPGCFRCKSLGITCTYKESRNIDGKYVPVPTTSSPDTRLNQTPYPVPARKEFPELVRSFQRWMGEACSTTTQSLAFNIRTIWVPYAFSDPCLFHSMLFYASAQTDCMNGGANRNPITLYHQNQAIQRLSRRLSVKGAIVDDSMIASVALLAMSACFANQGEAMEIHIRGLMSMVRAKGGLKSLGFAGSLINIVYMARIFSSIMNPGETVDIETASSCSPPAPLLPAILCRLRLVSSACETAGRILPLFLEVYEAVPRLQDFIAGQRSLCEWRKKRILTTKGQHYDLEMNTAVANKDTVFQACEASMRIFWSLIDGSSPLAAETLYQMFLDLKLALEATNLVQWMLLSPEALIWVSAVGAAISPTVPESWWFVTQGASMVMCTSLLQGSITEEAWFAFKWMRQLYRMRTLSE